MNNWNPANAGKAAQAERREIVYAKLRDLNRPRLVEENGRWHVPYVDNDGNRFTHKDYRMAMWPANAFLAGDSADVKTANRLIQGAELFHSCHFCAVASAVMLTHHKAKLEPATLAVLEKFLLSTLGDFMTRDFHFHGANDNAPMGCCAAISLAGSYFKNPSLIAYARERLTELCEYLDLRGYLHECVSPTYTGISLADIAELAEYTDDPETRKLAHRIESRLWQEALLHYHPEIGYWAGPYSRAYLADRDGHVTVLTLSFYAALGISGYLNPVETLFPALEGMRYHNSWDMMQRSFACQVAPVYHPPVELVAQALKKSYPLQITGSQSWMNTVYAPSSSSTVTCHMESDHTVASFGSNLMAGQSVPFQVLLKRAAKPAKLGDIRSIYSRMFLSDSYDSLKDNSLVVKDADYDNGSAFTVQDGNVVMLGYVPNATKPRDLATVRTTLYFPLFGSMPDEVYCGSQQVSGFSGAFQKQDWVFVREQDTYLAIHPMMTERVNCALAPIKLGVWDEMAMLSFYNMCDFQGLPYEVARQRAFGGGFVCEVGMKAEHGDFAAFRASFANASFSDEQWNGVRKMRYQHGKTTLKLEYDYIFLNLVHAVVNGKIRAENTKLETTGNFTLID